MSARNTAAVKKARRTQRVLDKLGAPITDQDRKHGICRPCGRRTIVWRPALLCESCLLSAAEQIGVSSVQS